jgi:hypothetical protein
VRLQRFGALFFLVSVEGFSPDSTARRHVGLLLRLVAPPLQYSSCSVSRSSVVLSRAVPLPERAWMTLY